MADANIKEEVKNYRIECHGQDGALMVSNFEEIASRRLKRRKGGIEALPKLVKDELVNLSAEQQSAFNAELNRRAKSTAVAYLAWFFLGWHYAYLDKWGWQVVFWLTLGGFFVWWFIDVFRVAGMVEDYNGTVSISVLKDMRTIAERNRDLIGSG